MEYSSTRLHDKEILEPSSMKELVRLECGHDVVLTALQLELFYVFDCKRCGAINQLTEVIGTVEDDREEQKEK